MKCFTISVLLFALITGGLSAFDEIDPDFVLKKEAISQKLRDKGFSDEEIQAIFSDKRITLYPEILNRSGKGLNYFNSKYGLLTRESILRGQRVLSENRDVLQEIEDRFGVEKEVLVAIYRLETNLGTYKSSHLVFNSLFTMSVLENRRSDWATEELINFLILCKKTNKDPYSIKGSWAGAFGLCQFVPSSFLHYGVDGNNDGEIDLFDFHDAMASIANYLKSHGWQTGDQKKNQKAVWSYNHCDNYVKAVLAYARATKRAMRPS